LEWTEEGGKGKGRRERRDGEKGGRGGLRKRMGIAHPIVSA